MAGVEVLKYIVVGVEDTEEGASLPDGGVVGFTGDPNECNVGQRGDI